MLDLKCEKYNKKYELEWDRFVLEKSINGTFLQTRNFLNYHKEKFEDASLIFYKGVNTIVAVVPACVIIEEGKKIYSSHKGSTFGGIIIGEGFNNIEHVEKIIDELEKKIITYDFEQIVLKCTSLLFSNNSIDLLYYLLFQKGYVSYDEISFYIDFSQCADDIISNFSASRRRDYRYSLKNNLIFREISSEEDLTEFYKVLCNNLQKYSTSPIHTLEELIDFKINRLKNIVEFYGVFNEGKLIAGSMIFNFNNQIFHTQYLAINQEYLKTFTMNFLNTNLIFKAKERGFKYFSFGTSTTDRGKTLNKSLAQFKEGYGTQYSLNRSFEKNIYY